MTTWDIGDDQERQAEGAMSKPNDGEAPEPDDADEETPESRAQLLAELTAGFTDEELDLIDELMNMGLGSGARMGPPTEPPQAQGK